MNLTEGGITKARFTCNFISYTLMRTVDITVVIPSVTIPESFGLTSNTEVSASEGWKKASSGSWYYTDANGRCYTGIHTINGKTYYFSMRGQLLS